MESQVYQLLHSSESMFPEALMDKIVCDTYKEEKYQIIASLMWYQLETATLKWNKEKLETEALEIIKKSLNFLEHLIKEGVKRCIDNAHKHEHVLQQQLEASESLKHTFDHDPHGYILKSICEKLKKILESLLQTTNVVHLNNSNKFLNRTSDSRKLTFHLMK